MPRDPNYWKALAFILTTSGLFMGAVLLVRSMWS